MGPVKATDGNYVPILAGIRYYATPNIFIGAKAGYAIAFSDGETGGAFNYEPHIGYNAEKFQINVNYNAFSVDNPLDPSKSSTWGHIGLGAIYKFN